LWCVMWRPAHVLVRARQKGPLGRARLVSGVPDNPRPRMLNYGVNVCHQGSKVVVEQFGKFHREVQPGLFFSIPLVEKLYDVDMREMVITVKPQAGVTKDNVRIDISGSLYLNFVDPYKALYGAKQPLVAAVLQAQAVMRSAVGSMELDAIFHNRDHLNEEIRGALEQHAETWGLRVTRYEITDIVPDAAIARAMDLQAAAERERRQQVKAAEAEKESTILVSEAQKARDVNESEGVRTRMENEAAGNAKRILLEAEAERERLIMEAEGRAQAIMKEAEANARAVSIMGDMLQAPNGRSALEARLAERYFHSLQELGNSQSTVVFMPSNLSDIPQLVAQGTAVWDTLRRAPNKGVEEPKPVD